MNCQAYGTDDEPREMFLRQAKVAVEPGLRFGAAGAGYTRLNFGTGAEILELATERMAAVEARRA